MKLTQTSSLATGLACSQCDKAYSIQAPQYFANCCNQPLVAHYQLSDTLSKLELIEQTPSMWRYSKLLPLFDSAHRVSLGEGMTPMLPMARLSKQYGFEGLWVKDEGANPTGSFKARGISMALSKALEHGAQALVVPTAGNAGGALSAYCAAAGLPATIVMPKETPMVFQDECRWYGANLVLHDGFIDQCGTIATQIQQDTGAFNLATLKEPYRLEGKKTMGYEIAEQLDWLLPDVIVYPTGGGTGLIGIWKAFKEMIQLGWIDEAQLPKMVIVQSDHCPAMVDYVNGSTHAAKEFKMSIANGLIVPKAFGQDMIKNVVISSGGTVATVSEEDMLSGIREISQKEGILVSPEGAAAWVALKRLTASGALLPHSRAVVLNTGNGYKYLESIRQGMATTL